MTAFFSGRESPQCGPLKEDAVFVVKNRVFGADFDFGERGTAIEHITVDFRDRAGNVDSNYRGIAKEGAVTDFRDGVRNDDLGNVFRNCDISFAFKDPEFAF